MSKSPPNIDKEELLIFIEKLFFKVLWFFISFHGAQLKTKSDEYEQTGHEIRPVNRTSTNSLFEIIAFSF